MAGKLDNVTNENWKTYENNLVLAADLLSKNNLLGVIKPVNQHSVPKYFLTVDIIKCINSPHLKLQLDIFHLQHICDDLSYNIKNLMPYVGHVQVAQVPNRNEPNIPGEINYQYILPLLEANGYNDCIWLEYKPAAGSKDGLKWIKEFEYS